jgi:glycosyltransferase involved in cell wall biosynthesis
MNLPAILHITVRADFGGGPEYVYRLSQGLVSQYNQFIACPKEDPYWSRYCRLLGDNNMCEIPHRAFTLRSLSKLKRLVVEKDISLIHSHGKGAGLYSRLLAIFSRRPCIHTYHGLHVGQYRHWTRLAYLGYERLFSIPTSQFICVSRSERDEVVSLRAAPADRVTVVNNGVYAPARDRVLGQLRSGPFTIVAANRYDYQKNAELILDIASIVRERTRPEEVKFILIGDGEKRGDIARLLKQRDLEKTVFQLGAVAAPRQIFCAAHVFLSTSRWEGMPLAVLEAMSEGMPIVASDVTGNRDIVKDGITGFLYPLDGPSVAADRILRLRDHRLWAEFARNAYDEVAKKYSVEQMTSSMAGIYDLVLSCDRPGNRPTRSVRKR